MVSTRGTTLYLRGVPEEVVREAKAAAAQEGVTLTAYVTEVLARAAGVGGRIDPPELEADWAWYEAHRERLAERFEGQYLAIADQEVVDADARFPPLARRVLDRYGSRPVLMPRCVSGGRVVSVPSPRVERR